MSENTIKLIFVILACGVVLGVVLPVSRPPEPSKPKPAAAHITDAEVEARWKAQWDKASHEIDSLSDRARDKWEDAKRAFKRAWVEGSQKK